MRRKIEPDEYINNAWPAVTLVKGSRMLNPLVDQTLDNPSVDEEADGGTDGRAGTEAYQSSRAGRDLLWRREQTARARWSVGRSARAASPVYTWMAVADAYGLSVRRLHHRSPEHQLLTYVNLGGDK